MPRIRISLNGARRRMTSESRELPELIRLLDTLTTQAVPLLDLAGHLGWTYRRLVTRIEGLRQRGIRIYTADHQTARIVDADSGAAIDLLDKLAPNRKRPQPA